jgi:hypothetical protein
MPCLGSDSIVRLSISAFRAEDPGSNPGRSTKKPSLEDSSKNGLSKNELASNLR